MLGKNYIVKKLKEQAKENDADNPVENNFELFRIHGSYPLLSLRA